MSVGVRGSFFLLIFFLLKFQECTAWHSREPPGKVVGAVLRLESATPPRPT